MTLKKLLKKFKSLLIKKGPSLVLGLFVFALTGSASSMCNFPHNPAALCAQVLPISSTLKNGKCLVKGRVLKVIRPAGVYHYDDSLKRVDFNSPQVVASEPVQTIYGAKEFCSSKSIVDKQKLSLIIKLNCYDEDASIPDFAWRVHNGNDELVDPWTKKKVKIDCGFSTKN